MLINTVGSDVYISTIGQKMSAFDRLPQLVREAMAASAIDWSPQHFVDYWMRGVPGYRNAAEMVKTIKIMDAIKIKRFYAAKKRQVTLTLRRK